MRRRSVFVNFAARAGRLGTQHCSRAELCGESHEASGLHRRQGGGNSSMTAFTSVAVLNGVTGTTLSALVNAGQIDFWLS
jgi:hypothetical protein